MGRRKGRKTEKKRDGGAPVKFTLRLPSLLGKRSDRFVAFGLCRACVHVNSINLMITTSISIILSKKAFLLKKAFTPQKKFLLRKSDFPVEKGHWILSLRRACDFICDKPLTFENYVNTIMNSIIFKENVFVIPTYIVWCSRYWERDFHNIWYARIVTILNL